MKQLARPASLVAALGRALGPTGTCALDPAVGVAHWRRALADPAGDFLVRPGKQLRTSIVRAGWMAGGGAVAAMPERLPLVIELLHAGSLIVDDVEDDSDERRGAPALHRLVGVPLAINTGSWMYFWALAELAELQLPAATALAAHQAAIATLVRCHQGQALDLAVRVTDLDVAEVSTVVGATTRLKTASLCAFAAELGALAADAHPDARRAIREFAEAMGVGLQMLDDLGALASPARRAKGREDLGAGRPTWPWAWLAELGPFAWARITAIARACPADDVDGLAEELREAVEGLGRARIRAVLATALDELRAAIGVSAVVDAIGAELRRMEASYG